MAVVGLVGLELIIRYYAGDHGIGRGDLYAGAFLFTCGDARRSEDLLLPAHGGAPPARSGRTPPRSSPGCRRRRRTRRLQIRLRHTPKIRVSAPVGVSIRVFAGAPVALVDHARAERSGLDQVQWDVLGNRW